MRLKFSKKEITTSCYYKRYIETPDEFDVFVTYRAKLSPKRDLKNELEAQYDVLRNK